MKKNIARKKIEAGIPQGRVLGQFFTCDIQQIWQKAQKYLPLVKPYKNRLKNCNKQLKNLQINNFKLSDKLLIGRNISRRNINK